MSDPAKPQPRCSRCGEPMVFSDSIALGDCLWCRPWPGRPVSVSAEHICDGGGCGLEPCAETPVHREPGHARTVRPPRAARRGEGGGE